MSAPSQVVTCCAFGSIKRRTASTASTQWSDDLPGDVLGTIYSSLASSLDRFRFAAVSRSWRAAAVAMRQTAPPALPWLLFVPTHEDEDNKVKRMYSPVDGEVFCVSTPSQLVGKGFLGSHDGGWIAAAGGREGSLVIVNFFTGAEVGLSVEQRKVSCQSSPCVMRKIIFSAAPTSSSCILAAITEKYGVALCKIGFPAGGWTTKEYGGGEPLKDITFYNGALYGLTYSEDLISIEIGTSKDGSPIVTATPHKLPIQRLGYRSTSMSLSCVIELHGKLALVVRARWLYKYKPFFKVFELADVATTPNIYKWVELTSLGDYAIFIGRTWSKSMYVPAGWHNGVQRNCIYPHNVVYLTSLDNPGGFNYLMQDESTGDGIKSAGSSVVFDPQGDTWIVPPIF